MTLLWRFAVASCLAGFVPATQAASTLKQIRAEHQQVLDSLNGKDADGKPLELDDERVPGLLKRGWELAGAWAAEFFEAHPAPSPSDLERVFEGFAPKPQGVKSQYGDFLEYREHSFEGSAIGIGAASYAIQARYFMWTSTGTFLVVARNRAGRFQALWNIKDLAEKHYAQRDAIGRWMHLVRPAYYNGALDVRRIRPLSPAANGHARFLVDAYQAAAAGGTRLAQLSMWEWNGAEAKPFLVKEYHYAADYDVFDLDGKTLGISTKEPLRTFYSCGMCPEPRGVWILRVTPDGVEDLGHHFLQPELRWADELFSKIDEGADTRDLAAVRVVTALKARIAEVRAEYSAQHPSWGFSWGMLDQCRVLRRGRWGAFELIVDAGRLRFSYALRNGRPYFTDVRIE